MKTTNALAMTLLGTAAACAGTTTLALHEGAADPTTEGFTFSNAGQMLGAVGPVKGDGLQMLDAWFTDDEGTDSNLSYRADLTAAQTAQMASAGFRLAVRMRTPTLNDATDFGMTVQVENGARQFLLRFGSAANGVPFVVANGDETTFVVPGPADSYHLYELIDDDADGDVDLYIDGNLRLANYAGLPSSERRVAFGDTSLTPGYGGRANWNLVVLQTFVPPACVGDVNGDSFIGFTDLNAIISRFNTECIGCPEDVNRDEQVNFTDLNIVVSSFNSDCP